MVRRLAATVAGILALSSAATHVAAPEGVTPQQWAMVAAHLAERAPGAAIAQAGVYPVPPGGCPGAWEPTTSSGSVGVTTLHELLANVREQSTLCGLTVRVEWDDGRSAIYRFVEVEGQWKQSDQAGAEFEMPVPIKNAADIPFKTSQFTFVRIKYSAHDRGPGAWAVDYPGADSNFSAQVERLTGLATDVDGHILELTDLTLGLYPFVYIVEGGSLRLSDDEVASLRSYLLGGGFLMIDDFWGEDDWALLSAELRRVFPELEPVELPADHEIFQSFYDMAEKPQVPSLIEIIDGDGESAERTYYRGLIGNDGRLMAIFCHNADFGDAWEYANRPEYPREISLGRAIPMGINIVVYALSH